ncbi:TetR/AcrR family transcriptional regulator [Virgibacillus halodenitrificans]|nr:TetR-like C-terminal domain-containing protein [Virgibacillus halodenitrificans]MCJ0932447.1 TetR family transcriptional regulator C-terminal domain-containing protein [Virgibacillus halodenitrificans]MEC2158019.1 TetR-like C-terminal domain-containing protein [Virgibacillus halodenitrificans]WHX24908.1 TetR-like C-terminal domain-containing protein [Virgibacillus halodenitrificans]
MTSEKLDRRKKYTRMVLKDSLMKLLQNKQISAITVKEVCELADINRSTFYAHYADQFDLLEQIEEELIEDLNMYLSGYDFESEDESLQMTERLIEYFGSKQDECQTLLNINEDSSFQTKVMDVAQHFLMKNWMEVSRLDHDMSEYISSFIISGSIQIMKVWLNNGMDKSSKEMAQLITNLVNQGLSGLK